MGVLGGKGEGHSMSGGQEAGVAEWNKGPKAHE